MKLILGTSLIALLSLLMTSTINAADFNGDGKTDLRVDYGKNTDIPVAD